MWQIFYGLQFFEVHFFVFEKRGVVGPLGFTRNAFIGSNSDNGVSVKNLKIREKMEFAQNSKLQVGLRSFFFLFFFPNFSLKTKYFKIFHVKHKSFFFKKKHQRSTMRLVFRLVDLWRRRWIIIFVWKFGRKKNHFWWRLIFSMMLLLVKNTAFCIRFALLNDQLLSLWVRDLELLGLTFLQFGRNWK